MIWWLMYMLTWRPNLRKISDIDNENGIFKICVFSLISFSKFSIYFSLKVLSEVDRKSRELSYLSKTYNGPYVIRPLDMWVFHFQKGLGYFLSTEYCQGDETVIGSFWYFLRLLVARNLLIPWQMTGRNVGILLKQHVTMDSSKALMMF